MAHVPDTNVRGRTGPLQPSRPAPTGGWRGNGKDTAVPRTSLRRVAALAPAAIGLALVAVPPAVAGAATPVIRVSPHSALHNGETVRVTGSGLPATTHGKPNAYFITECNAKVAGALSLKDEPDCAVALAKAVKVSRAGTFSTTYTVHTGKVGNGTCPAGGHCVIGVGDVAGQGGVARIAFG